ncbi:MAG TPA: TonB-dependent copper receptor [Candidatus Thiothrix moscowensis]|mgnify:CR=1 FL=1|uniref:TonB-dependent copper receptor n=1 Tax=unclassified Thiothrix TaxID=2636184 RepID=UPI0025DBF9BC|nr:MULTISPECIES: TonB-dependent copper receptor [unclassified Thiothrix]HRJ52400.1 TonB-dependent copper receptor [Candidatus Thiothrix moscowensis]HRJ92715.1 TonB-dependent copper receptor [Candidatus Thiothrix moscowensis]
MQRSLTRVTLLSSLLILSASALAEDTLVVDIKASKKVTPNETQPKAAERRPVLPADGGDFLKQLNGVSGSRFGGRGIEPIIRGQSQTQLNVLLDGAYIHGGCPNRMDPPASYAALETYESVKVEKGVQSLQHGSGGSGGTVLFERDTRNQIDPEDGLSGKVSLTGSNNGIKHDLSADVTKGGEKGYVRVFAQDRDADNYEDGDGKKVNSAYKHKQGGIVLGATPTQDRLFEYSYENNDFSDALYPGAGMDSPTEKADIHRLKYQDKFDGAVKSIDAEAYASNVEHVMDNYSLRTNMGMKMSVPTTSDTTGGKLVLTSKAGNHTAVTYGLNVQNRERNATMKNITTGMDASLMWPGATTDQTGLFAEAETKLGESSKLKYGLRVDQVKASASKVNTLVGGRTANQNYTAVYGYGATDKKETNTGGLLRYEKALNENTTVFTGVSRSVRTADETERYINKWGATGADRWVGNPNIKPEKHNQLDLGVSQHKGNVRWTGTVFADQVDDFILRDKLTSGAHSGAQIYRNVDAKLYGVELGAETKLSQKVKLSGDVAYVKRTNTTDNRPIAQTPPVNGKVQLDYNGEKWGGGTRVRFANGQSNIDTAMLGATEVGESSGYGVLDAYGRYNISKNTKVRFGVDNVFDKTYAEHVSRRNLDLNGTIERVNEPGRTAWLKLETEF